MFTGIIEEVGKILKISPISGGKRLVISANKILADLQIDHSVSISGICLTVIEIGNGSFTVEAVGETLGKTSIRKFNINIPVNLERALKFNDRLGGHLIQGHVNGIGTIQQIKKRGDNWYLEVLIPPDLMHYLIIEGSIAIDGISLTIAHMKEKSVGISIIPHTYKNTVISSYTRNQEVNIEVDFFARYIERILNNKLNKRKEIRYTSEWFKNLGY